jgi:MerR family transcriptional regulator/heat shock protein HspR
MADRRFERDPARPCFVISVAAGMVQAHPRTLRIYEDEGLLAPARTPTNIRLYSENDIRRILWIRRLTQERGVNLAGVRLLFELEERLGTRILEALFDEDRAREAGATAAARQAGPNPNSSESTETPVHRASDAPSEQATGGSTEDPDDGRSGGSAFASTFPTRRPITRIVATRVATSDRTQAVANRSGDTDD